MSVTIRITNIFNTLNCSEGNKPGMSVSEVLYESHQRLGEAQISLSYKEQDDSGEIFQATISISDEALSYLISCAQEVDHELQGQVLDLSGAKAVAYQEQFVSHEGVFADYQPETA